MMYAVVWWGLVPASSWKRKASLEVRGGCVEKKCSREGDWSKLDLESQSARFH